MESERDFQPNEDKLQFVYHGTITGDIDTFEPRKRYTPGGEDVPPRVYAAPNPVFAAAHSFPWSSEEGIDVRFEGEQVVLVVPEKHKERLKQEVFIYKLLGDNFHKTEEEKTGETYHTDEVTTPEDVLKFSSVSEAVEYFGGRVEIV